MSTSISALQATTAGSDAQGTSKASLGKDDFLKLLIAQVSNQDPLSPMDNQAFVAQLAQFANVEQLQAANTRLDTLALAQAGANQTAAATLVGKDVSFRSSQIQLSAGAPAAVGAQLQGNASSVTAVIADASGNTVRTLRFGAAASGSFSASWDGLDDRGMPMPAGTYRVRITAADGAGKSVSAVPQGSGRVTGVSFASGAAELIVAGAHIRLADVIEIDQATP